MKNNCFEQESGDAFLYLVKENPQIIKCKLGLNMIRYQQNQDIERTCKHNLTLITQLHVPQIKKEIKGLKRLKKREAHSLHGIYEDLERGKLNISQNLQVIHEVEDKLEQVREEQRTEKMQSQLEMDAHRKGLNKFYRQEDEQDQEHIHVKCQWQRKLED